MNESIQILLLSGSLITGILSIILSNQLVRKYNLPWLSSYFYFLIFLFIFGIYGIIGSRLVKMYLLKQGMDVEAVESISQFMIFLGIPFLILAWYMFLRLSHEMVNLRLNPLFNLLFFGVLSLGLTGFGLALTGRDRLGENPYQTIRLIMISGFTVLTVLIYAYSLFQLFLHSRKFLDQKDRSNIRLFGLIYLIFAGGTVILLNIAERGILLSLAFITLLLSIHLIPVFFMSMYLDRYFVEPVARYEFERSLKDFIREFEISKRESEIVELICKGKSNRDISDSLFISLQTVKDHVHRIYLKTGVKNRVQLTNLIRTFR